MLKVWAKIASKMNEVVAGGVPLTGAQCDSKWKGLKSTFKANKNHNKRSGVHKKSWEYYEVRGNVENC